MIKRLSAVLVALMTATLAAAQDAQPQAQVAAVIECLDIAAVDERVRCYDRAATVLRAGLRSGAVVVAAPRRSETPSRVQARVTSATWPEGRWELALDNGQRWRSHERKEQRPPATGTTVRIDRNLIGSYWMRVPGHGQIRVDRVQ